MEQPCTQTSDVNIIKEIEDSVAWLRASLFLLSSKGKRLAESTDE